MTARRTVSRFGAGRFVGALFRITGGSLFFVLLAASLGLPADKRPAHRGAASADTGRGGGVTWGAGPLPRDVPRAALATTRVEASGVGESEMPSRFHESPRFMIPP